MLLHRCCYIDSSRLQGLVHQETSLMRCDQPEETSRDGDPPDAARGVAGDAV
jgi:hypothetical protein